MKKLAFIPVLFIASNVMAAATLWRSPFGLLSTSDTWTATQNFSTITVKDLTVTSTFTLSGGTFCVNENVCYVFPSSAPIAGQHWIITANVGKFYYVSFGDDAVGSGSGGGGGGGGGFIFNGSQIQSISTFTIPGFPVSFNSGFATITVLNATPSWIGSNTFFGTTTFRNTIGISSPTGSLGFFITTTNAVAGYEYIRLSTGESPNYDITVSSLLTYGVTYYLLNGSLELGTTVASMQANVTGTFEPILHIGRSAFHQPNTNNITGSSKIDILHEIQTDGTYNVFFKDGGPIFFTRINQASSKAQLGTLNSNSLELDTNNTAAFILDTSQNATITGVLKESNGTPAAPAYTFTNRISAGLVLDPPSLPVDVLMATNGKERFRWKDSGDIVTGGRNIAGASVDIGTGSVPNAPIMTIGSGTARAEFTGDSSTVFNQFWVVGRSTFMGVIMTTADVQVGGVNFTNYMSTADAQQNKFVNFRSTTDSVILTTGSAVTAVSLATASLQAFYAGFTSTSDARGNTFVNFRSTTDSTILTTGTALINYITINATNTNITSSSPTFTSFVTFRSSAGVLISSGNVIISTGGLSVNTTNFLPGGLLVHNGSVTISGLNAGLYIQGVSTISTPALEIRFSSIATQNYTLVFASVIGGVGDRLIITQINGSNYLIGSGKAVAAGGGGGGGSAFSFDGTIATAFSTMSIQTPFGQLATVANSPTASTFTILGTTAPYRSFALGAGSWLGVLVSSGSAENNGFAQVSTYTAAYPYTQIPTVFHTFTNSTRTCVYADINMPYEWDGSSIGVNVSWFASSGTANKNCRWCMAAVAISSGASAENVVFTSSACAYSTFIGGYKNARSPTFSLTPEGNAQPGDNIRALLFVDGNDGNDTFDGIPRMTNVQVLYRTAIWDGKPR